MRGTPLLTLALLNALGCAEPGAPVEPSPAAQEQTAQPQTAQPQTAQPQTAQPQTAQPQTPGTETPGEATARDLPFQLEWQRSSGAMLRDQISLSSTGHLVWVGQVVTGNTGTMRVLELDLDEAEVRSVREAIEGADFFALPVQPPPSSLADGAGLVMRLHLGDRQHHVRVEEPLPAGAQRIHDAIDALLGAERQAQLSSAREVRPGDLDPTLAPR